MRPIERVVVAFAAILLALCPAVAEISSDTNNVCTQAQALYEHAEYKQAESILKGALDQSEKSGNVDAIASAKLLNDLALVEFKSGNRSEAAALLDRAKTIAQSQKDDRLYAAVLTNTAILKKREKQFGAAMTLAQEALKIAGQKREQAEILAVISGIYHDQNKLKEARKYREQIFNLLNDKGDAADASINMGKMAELDEELKDPKAEEGHLLAAVKLAEAVPKQEDDYILLSKLLKLSEFYQRQHNFVAVESILKRVVATDLTNQDSTNIIGGPILLGRFYMERNRKAEGRKLYKQAEADVLASKLDSTDKAHQLTSLADWVNGDKEYVLANEIYSQAISLLQQLYDKNHNSREGKEAFDLEMALFDYAKSAEAAGNKTLASQLRSKSQSISKRRIYYAHSIGMPAWPEEPKLRFFSREEPDHNGIFLR